MEVFATSLTGLPAGVELACGKHSNDLALLVPEHIMQKSPGFSREIACPLATRRPGHKKASWALDIMLSITLVLSSWRIGGGGGGGGGGGEDGSNRLSLRNLFIRPARIRTRWKLTEEKIMRLPVTFRKMLAVIGLMLPALVANNAAGAITLEEITSRGSVRIGVVTGAPPMGMVDESGNPTGYDVDVANLIGGYLVDALFISYAYAAIPHPGLADRQGGFSGGHAGTYRRTGQDCHVYPALQRLQYGDSFRAGSEIRQAVRAGRQARRRL